jgi:hypothetical protein
MQIKTAASRRRRSRVQERRLRARNNDPEKQVAGFFN